MTKKILLILIFGILTFNFASALQEDCNLQISLLNQDPISAIPGDYVDVVFQVTGLEKSVCSGAVFQIEPSYPFSLDEEPQILTMQGSTWSSSNYKNYWTIPYKLRVDENALDGANELKVSYGEESLILSKSFNISIEDSRTSFDAVIQEISDSEVSIAIANIGKYTANSVVVRIPQQDNFKATETDGQMVGSLDSGDYTIVSFAISKTMQRDSQNENTNILQFDIYYTDALGERRIENMELELNLRNSISSTDAEETENTNFPAGPGMKQQQSFFSSNYVKGAILFLLIIGLIYIYKKYPKKIQEIKSKIISKFHKKKSEKKSPHEIPEWIKNLEKKDKAKKE